MGGGSSCVPIVFDRVVHLKDIREWISKVLKFAEKKIRRAVELIRSMGNCLSVILENYDRKTHIIPL